MLERPHKEALDGLLNEVRLLFHRAVQAAESLHAGSPVSLGMRAVLESIQRDGPATVPQVARRRYVTRQHIQSLVNALVDAGFVTVEPNPAHRRSGLVTLTPAGRRAIEGMKRREARLWDETGLDVSADAVEQAARTLARVRRALRTES